MLTLRTGGAAMLNLRTGGAVLAVVALPVVVWVVSVTREIIGLQRRRRRVNQLPGLPVSFIVGNLPQIPKPFDERFFRWIREMVAKYPYVFRFQLNPFRATAFVCHPKTIKLLLKSSEPKDTLRFGGYSLLLPWLGEGLLISHGQQWFRNRRLLTPAFHFDILKPYMTIYNECVEILMGKWESHCASGKSLDIYGDVSLCSLNIIMRCAFSCEEDVQKLGTTHPYVQAVYRLAEISQNRNLRPMTQINWIYKLTSEGREFDRLCKYVHDVAEDIIEKRKVQLNEEIHPKDSKHNRLDFLDILLSAKDDEGHGLSDREIRQEVDTFLFEGHDTTASGTSWILYAFARHPEIQERVRQEIDGLLVDRADSRVIWEDLNELPYTSLCIKEAMRLYSPVPGISRKLTQPLTLEGVELLPGTAVVIGLYAMHHNPTVWGDDHMEYKPERFLPENMTNMDSYAYCPFAAGPRNCIGQNFAMNEIKTLVCRVLHKYILEVDTTFPEAQPVPNLVLRPHNGLHVKLKSRNTSY